LVKINLDVKFVFNNNISGEEHLLLLTESGQLYSVGNAEQGRLGRIGQQFVDRGGRRGLALPLTPGLVQTKDRRIIFAGKPTLISFVKPT
jgi:hypothetical protein